MITTHVLDTALGRPAAGVPIRLEHRHADGWGTVGEGETDSDGRLRTLTASGALATGHYRITFDTAAYFAASKQKGFYPHVQVDFVVDDAAAHFHVPLLLAPWGYSTYRGS